MDLKRKDDPLPPARRLILLGAGHAHLLLTERVAELRAAGLDPLLIAPRIFHYSGLATAVLSGALPEGANCIDVAALAARSELDHIHAAATAVDPGGVTLSDGSVRPFDLLSLNTGSEIRDTIAGAGTIWPVKPLDRLVELRAALRERMATAPAIVVAGAGPTGAEIAAAIAGLFERAGEMARLHLVGRQKEGAGWRSLYRSLENRGVTMIPEARVAERSIDAVTLDNGAILPCDFLVAATGLQPAPFGAAVAATLRSLDDRVIFAAGDCADFTPRPLPSLGVFGVREAPVLAHNLIAAAQSEPLIPYRPQRRWLSILDLGNGEGFATWGGFANRSRAALRLKRHLDLRFVARFQAL